MAVPIPQPRYRFGFILTTAAGNQTRYLNLRKYADRDPEVECVWAPVSHFLDPDPYQSLPNALRTRLIARRQSESVMKQLNRLDAVMFHLFEAYAACALRSVIARHPALVWSQDNPPDSGKSAVPQYGGIHDRPNWRKSLRYRFDLWCMRRTNLFIPFSPWTGKLLVEECGIPAASVHPINVGLDLELWRYVPRVSLSSAQRPQILFVGGGLVRKGGDLLLDVFTKHFAEVADLHMVVKDFSGPPPPHVRIYDDLNPNDERLRNLYTSADMFVLPTRADVSSWVAMEAMATGLPVVITNVGGIPDIVTDGETGFLIEPNDGAALANRIRLLIDAPAQRQQMGADARAFIERNYNAGQNVPRILETMKQAVQHNGGPLSDRQRA